MQVPAFRPGFARWLAAIAAAGLAVRLIYVLALTPHLRGRPSGSRVLDDYLTSEYRLLERLYHYDVLVPR